MLLALTGKAGPYLLIPLQELIFPKFAFSFLLILKNATAAAKPPVLAGVTSYGVIGSFGPKKDTFILMTRIIKMQIVFTAILHLNLLYGLKT